MQNNINKIVQNARISQSELGTLSEKERNKILKIIKQTLINNSNEIITQNKKDISNAKKNGMKDNLIDRLSLDQDKINLISKSIDNVISQPDPLWNVIRDIKLHNNIKIERISCPIGLIGIIYESRPNVTVDAIVLCVKSGNACILRGGSDSFFTSSFLVDIIKKSLKNEGFENIINSINYIQTKDRDAIKNMIADKNNLDLVIPRGGRGLIEFVSQYAKVPVLKHLDGNCHTYINKFANIEKSLYVIKNAKLRKTSVCCATESILIDEEIANDILPKIQNILTKCEIRGCEKTFKILPNINLAKEDDYYTEYLDSIVSIKIVQDYNDAINHINKYSSNHTESILTEDKNIADRFFCKVDSAVIMHNASTQFSDGYEMGLGAEIGISTDKIHARGPVALEGLTVYKYKVVGSYDIRK